MRVRGRLGIGACAVVALAIGIAYVTARSPRPAPAGITSTRPADGAVLATAPDEVELSFATAVNPDLSHLTVRDGSGRALNAGQPRLIRPDQLRQAVGVAAGDVTVAYHVTFVDGAELAGTLHFSVGAGTGRPPAGAAHEAGAGAPHHGVDPISAALLALDGIVVLAVVVLLVRRPRPRPGGVGLPPGPAS